MPAAPYRRAASNGTRFSVADLPSPVGDGRAVASRLSNCLMTEEQVLKVVVRFPGSSIVERSAVNFITYR